MSRICIVGGPRTGKTTLAPKVCIEIGEEAWPRLYHTDDLIALGWSEASEAASRWLDDPGPWVIEGVALSRALRKWRDAHPGEPPPVDKIIRLTTPHVPLTKGQATMAKGEETVWQEIAGWLYAAGVPRAELAEVSCEHPGCNGKAAL